MFLPRILGTRFKASRPTTYRAAHEGDGRCPKATSGEQARAELKTLAGTPRTFYGTQPGDGMGADAARFDGPVGFPDGSVKCFNVRRRTIIARTDDSSLGHKIWPV